MLLVVLPWPVRQVWPNYRQSHHWRSYYKQVKAQRQYAWGMTLVVKHGQYVMMDDKGRIPMHVRFVPPDRIKRDDDGMAGAFKSARDGIADALGIDDSRFRVTYEYAETPEKPGRLEVTIG